MEKRDHETFQFDLLPDSGYLAMPSELLLRTTISVNEKIVSTMLTRKNKGGIDRNKNPYSNQERVTVHTFHVIS